MDLFSLPLLVAVVAVEVKLIEYAMISHTTTIRGKNHRITKLIHPDRSPEPLGYFLILSQNFDAKPLPQT
jgi:hypothetical protein